MQVTILVSLLFGFIFFVIYLTEQDKGMATLKRNGKKEMSRDEHQLGLANVGQRMKTRQDKILVKIRRYYISNKNISNNSTSKRKEQLKWNSRFEDCIYKHVIVKRNTFSFICNKTRNT